MEVSLRDGFSVHGQDARATGGMSGSGVVFSVDAA